LIYIKSYIKRFFNVLQIKKLTNHVLMCKSWKRREEKRREEESREEKRRE
jgi:hypothetical protein